MGVVQAVEGEGCPGGDGAVAEVEDPGGPVGEHQPQARHPVERTGHDAGDEIGQEAPHGRHTSQAQIGPLPVDPWLGPGPVETVTALPRTSTQPGR